MKKPRTIVQEKKKGYKQRTFGYYSRAIRAHLCTLGYTVDVANWISITFTSLIKYQEVSMYIVFIYLGNVT